MIGWPGRETKLGSNWGFVTPRCSRSWPIWRITGASSANRRRRDSRAASEYRMALNPTCRAPLISESTESPTMCVVVGCEQSFFAIFGDWSLTVRQRCINSSCSRMLMVLSRTTRVGSNTLFLIWTRQISHQTIFWNSCDGLADTTFGLFWCSE
jgi:hypothetical protein